MIFLTWELKGTLKPFIMVRVVSWFEAFLLVSSGMDECLKFGSSTNIPQVKV